MRELFRWLSECIMLIGILLLLFLVASGVAVIWVLFVMFFSN